MYIYFIYKALMTYKFSLPTRIMFLLLIYVDNILTIRSKKTKGEIKLSKYTTISFFKIGNNQSEFIKNTFIIR